MATFTVPQSPHPAGNYSFGPFAVPAGTTHIVAEATLSDADAGDTSLSISFSVEKSMDGGATWLPEASYTWQGGPSRNGIDPPPRPSFDLTFMPGTTPTHLRVNVTLPRALNVGATVTTS